MNTKIYHTVNNGFYFENENIGVFADGIHLGKNVGFSDTPKDVIEKCLNKSYPFEKIAGLVFTHCHPDHFNGKTAETLVKNNAFSAYDPEDYLTNVRPVKVDENTSYFRIGEFEFFAVGTKHDGPEPISDIPHVSLIIKSASEVFFMAGDAVFLNGADDADRFLSLCGNRVDAAFVNPYQLLMKKNRLFLDRLCPKKLVLSHMPFGEDGINKTITLFHTAQKKYFGNPDFIVPGYMSFIDL